MDSSCRSRIITNLKPEVRDNVYCFMYPEEYAMTENDESDSSSSTSDEEELGNDDEEEHEQRDVAQHYPDKESFHDSFLALKIVVVEPNAVM